MSFVSVVVWISKEIENRYYTAFVSGIVETERA